MNPLHAAGRPFPMPSPGLGQTSQRVIARGGQAGDAASSPKNPFSLGSIDHLGDPSASATPKPDKLTGLLVDQVREVNAMQAGADAMVHSMITGGDVSEAEVLTAVQKADLAFRMLLQIRNKLMDAYREIQQIQI